MAADRESIRRMHRHLDYRAVRRHPVVVLLDNVDKASNTGGILRAADAFLCERVIINRPDPDVAGAMGAEHWQPVEWGADLTVAAGRLRSAGYRLAALEQAQDGIPINRYRFAEHTALIVGSEMFGVSEALMDMADDVVFIPQAGLIKSLNVVTATAIGLYEYARQWWLDVEPPSLRHLSPATESQRLKRHRTTKEETPNG